MTSGTSSTSLSAPPKPPAAGVSPEFMWVADTQQRCIYANPAWLEFTGRTIDEEFESGWIAHIHPDDREGVHACHAAACAARISLSFTCRIECVGGGYQLVQGTGTPLIGACGAVEGVVMCGTAVHSSPGRTPTTESVEASYRLALDAVAEGVCMLDRHGTFTFVNASGAATLGYAPESLLGMSMHETVHYQHADGSPYKTRDCPILTAIANDRVMLNESDVFWRRNGTNVLVEYAVYPFRTAAGPIAGAVVAFRDVAAERETQHALAEYRDHLDEMVDARTRDLALLTEQAERASKAKTDFVTNMSHELRTPMHAILSFASLGVDRISQVPLEKLLSYFQQIKDSGTRLLGLLNNLLDLSRLEAGHMPVSMEWVDIVTLVRALEAQTEALLEQKGLRLCVDVRMENTIVRCDGNLMSQLLWNLVSNAVKFTPAGRQVLVAFESCLVRVGRRRTDHAEAPGVHITVQDQGIGIPEHELADIFEKFVQSSQTVTGAGGTGLGLSICREIVVMHGGHVWAENHPDGGAVFHVTMPIDPRGLWNEAAGDGCQADT